MKKKEKLKILVLGMSGMIGCEIFKFFNNSGEYIVYGSSRKNKSFSKSFNKNILYDFNVFNKKKWKVKINSIKPDVIINCIGITKHIKADDKEFETVNSTFPKELSILCNKISAKLIQISTDCVFSGTKGFYSEKDVPDSKDIYGLSKIQGEIIQSPHLTLRTSTIGHEILTKNGLLEWFLSQSESCKGYPNAIFSGITTYELSKALEKIIKKNFNLSGLYHLSSSPISKYNLLKLIKKTYSKKIKIEKDCSFIINRTLNGEKLKKAINYRTNSWEYMIEEMFNENKGDKVV